MPKSATYPRNIATDLSQTFLRLSYGAARVTQHYGADAVIQVIRWQETIEKSDPDFYVNNDVTAYLSRWAMWVAPSLWDLRADGHPFFHTRISRADHSPYHGHMPDRMITP